MFGGAFGPPFAFSSPIFLATQYTPLPPPSPTLKLHGCQYGVCIQISCAVLLSHTIVLQTRTNIYVYFAAKPRKTKKKPPNIYVLLQEAEFKT